MIKQQACAKIIGQLHKIDKTRSTRTSQLLAALGSIRNAQANGYSFNTIEQCAL